ncbi:hypothetical protein, partial [Enterococcus gallinarum]|uniref:hypothetical protein n=1 Tax=Enterococcus gallinarum TaxID=1353 RepID=UPI003D0A9CF7
SVARAGLNLVDQQRNRDDKIEQPVINHVRDAHGTGRGDLGGKIGNLADIESDHLMVPRWRFMVARRLA